VGLRADLDIAAKIKFLPCRESNPGRRVVTIHEAKLNSTHKSLFRHSVSRSIKIHLVFSDLKHVDRRTARHEVPIMHLICTLRAKNT
jgi:hypothetical protein